MKTWLKGGLWGIGIIFAGFVIIAIVSVMMLNRDTPGMGFSYFSYYLSYFVILLLFAIILAFLVGAFIGFIVGKIKNKNK